MVATEEWQDGPPNCWFSRQESASAVAASEAACGSYRDLGDDGAQWLSARQ